jgi:hypothetical protein
MLAEFFMQFDKVHVAKSREELDAIYRFRYTVYVKELKREIGGVDHDRQMVTDQEDEKPYSYHLYVGSIDNIVGTVRLRIWEPGEVPEYEFNELSMSLFKDAEQLTTAELGRFMIKSSRRGKLILPSIANGAYNFLVQEKNVDLAFLYCRPGLVNHYRRLGARPYGGNMVDAPEGMEVPLVMISSDYDYYKKMKSPLASSVKKLFGSGKRKTLDLSQYSHLLNDNVQPVITDTKEVWMNLQAHLLIQPDNNHSFLDSLPDKTIKKLAEFGFIMDAPEGMLITREGHSEREMYIILDGILEVFQEDKVLRRLTKGDVFGEVAFFRESGQRSASVRSIENGRIITIRRKFLDQLSKSDPKMALNIMFNLAQILSERLADKTDNENNSGK